MLDSFHKRRENFDKLRQMMSSDKLLQAVFQDRSIPDYASLRGEGFSEKRIQDYRFLLKLIDIRGIMKYPDSIVFEARSFGIGLQGTYKGYLYSEIVPKKIEANLDDVSGGNCDYVARRIEDHWFLYIRDCTSRNERVTHGPPDGAE